MVSIPNVAMSLYSQLKVRKFKWALAIKESVKWARLWKPHRDEWQPKLRRRSKLKPVFKTIGFFKFFPDALHLCLPSNMNWIYKFMENIILKLILCTEYNFWFKFTTFRAPAVVGICSRPNPVQSISSYSRLISSFIDQWLVWQVWAESLFQWHLIT